MPARKVTACTFGGEHLDQLFITTSQESINTREDPLAGSLFRANVGVKAFRSASLPAEGAPYGLGGGASTPASPVRPTCLPRVGKPARLKFASRSR